MEDFFSQNLLNHPLVTLSHTKHAHYKICVLSVYDKCVVFTLTVAPVEMGVVHERNIKKLGKQKRPQPVLPERIAVVVACRCCSGCRSA